MQDLVFFVIVVTVAIQHELEKKKETVETSETHSFCFFLEKMCSTSILGLKKYW